MNTRMLMAALVASAVPSAVEPSHTVTVAPSGAVPVNVTD